MADTALKPLFQDIADAIREKDETTAPIPAENFPDRIRAIPTGGGSADFAVPLVVTLNTDAEVAATNGDITVSGTTDSNNIARLILPAPGVWTIAAKHEDIETFTEVEVIDGYSASLLLLSRPPIGYTEVEYISPAPKTYSYVSTDLYYPDVSKIEMDIQPEAYTSGASAAQHFVRAGNNFGVWRYPGTSTRYFIGTTTTSNFTYTIPSSRFLFVLDTVTKLLKFGDIRQQTISVYSAESQDPVSIFGDTHGFPIPCKMWSCKFYDENDALISNLVPCISPSEEIGLYDIQRGKFFAGSGNLTAGPAV